MPEDPPPPEAHPLRDQDQIWQYFQTEGVAHFADSGPRLGHLASRLAPPSRVLDIGVGAGVFEAAALERGLDVYSLDPSEEAIASLRSRFGLDATKAQVGRAEDLPWDDGTFDAVVASEVLEHLEDDVLQQAVREVRRVLRDGGRFLGTVPADEDLTSATVVCPACGLRFHRWGHQQSFSSDRLQSMLAAAGFRVTSIERRTFVHWAALNWKGKLEAAFRRVTEQLARHGPNQVYVFDSVCGS